MTNPTTNDTIAQFEHEVSSQPSQLTQQQQRQADKLALIEAKARAKKEELLIKQQIKQQELAAKAHNTKVLAEAIAAKALATQQAQELKLERRKQEEELETNLAKYYETMKAKTLAAQQAKLDAKEQLQQEQAAKQAARQDLSQYLHPKNYAVTEDFDISQFREHFPTYDTLEQAIVNTPTARLKIKDTELPDFAGNRYLPSEIQDYLNYLIAHQCKGRTPEQAEEIMQRDIMLMQQVEDFKAQGYLPNQIVQLRTRVFVKS